VYQQVDAAAGRRAIFIQHENVAVIGPDIWPQHPGYKSSGLRHLEGRVNRGTKKRVQTLNEDEDRFNIDRSRSNNTKKKKR